MRIAIDLSSATVGAGAVYAENILAGLARVDESNEFVVLLTTKAGIPIPRQQNFSSVRWAPRSPVIRIPFLQTIVPAWLKRRRVDVLVSPFEYTILGASCPVVLGMQNLIPYCRPSASTKGANFRCRMIRRLAWFSVRRASRIFFLSDASRQVICDRLGIGVEKTAVIPYGLDTDSLAAGENGRRQENNVLDNIIAGPYILSVSSVMAHKDFESLLQACASLLHRGIISHRLLIAGPLHDKAYLAKLRSLISALQLADKVVFLGEVAHRSLGRLYGHADVTVLPSRTETFGMPIIEAMACGSPVIASDLPALREVAGEAGMFYSPGDAQGLCGRLERILTDSHLRACLVKAGVQRAAHFSWDAAARDVLLLINQAMDN
jgi:glycosyltransferase involved in cell wall biosynthesis